MSSGGQGGEDGHILVGGGERRRVYDFEAEAEKRTRRFDVTSPQRSSGTRIDYLARKMRPLNRDTVT
jgi:hypothetical protein